MLGNVLSASMWQYGTPEPANCMVTDADGSHDVGRVGLAVWAQAFSYWIDWFAVTVNGTTAPFPQG